MSLSSLPVAELNPEREQWGNKWQFFLASLGYCVGQGALTRFPYLVMKNGGGAFLIPFTIFMIIAAIPLFYLELALGQFSGKSPLTMWSLCPAMSGIGLSTSLLAIIVAVYFMTYTCFAGEVPWKYCDPAWASPACSDRQNGSLELDNDYGNATTPSEEYWNYHVLGLEKVGLTQLGGIQWQLALCHLFVWVTVFFCTMKGATSAGKVVYVTATLPYILLTALFIRGVTLEGSMDGLVFFLKPDFEKLKSLDVWIEACLQVFVQLGPGWGGLITMASYNHFNHRCYRDAIAVTLLNLFTSIFGGLAIFSVLGFMANRYGVSVGKVAGSGPGLAFVAYPAAIAQMPFPPIWSLVFFLMLMTVGIDSLFGMFDTMVCGLLDKFPELRKRQILVTGLSAAVMYLLGLVFCTQGGMYLFQLLDWYASVLSLMAICFLESIVVCYIYGFRRFSSDIALMLGSPPNIIWAIGWMGVVPLLTLLMIVVGLWNLDRPFYEFTGFRYVYPDWAVSLGWGVAFLSFAPTPIIMVIVIARTPGTFVEKIKNSFKADPSWLPNNKEIVDEYRRRWYGIDSGGDEGQGGMVMLGSIEKGEKTVSYITVQSNLPSSSTLDSYSTHI